MMDDRIITATLLVRDVAEGRLQHGDRTFGYGLVLMLVLTPAGLLAASFMRISGLI